MVFLNTITLKQITFFSLLIVFFSSCVTNKKIQYLQEVDEEEIPKYERFTPTPYRIQVGDELYIDIKPYDEDLSKSLGGDLGRNQLTTPAAINVHSYGVEDDGTIQFPLTGPIKVEGLTTREVHKLIDGLLRGKVYGEAELNVKLVNKYVSLVGDFKKPGRYLIYKDQLNIFQALAMGGDLTDFGDRTRVRIIRQMPDGQVVKEFDLRSVDVLGSEFYFVQPNDVIYVSRFKGQFFKMDSFTDFVTILTSSISFTVLVLTLVNN